MIVRIIFCISSLLEETGVPVRVLPLGLFFYCEVSPTAYKEPHTKRVSTFFDLQNLFLSAKSAWGYTYPNLDPVELSRFVVQNHNDWLLTQIKLYTGIHDVKRNPAWHNFWQKKLAAHRKQDTRVSVFTAPLHYNNNVANEKGIDIRIALDLVRMARLDEYDVAVLFSRDSDFREVALEIRAIASEKNRWIKIASAFPDDIKTRGVDQTDWIRISKTDYDNCLDSNDYR